MKNVFVGFCVTSSSPSAVSLLDSLVRGSFGGSVIKITSGPRRTCSSLLELHISVVLISCNVPMVSKVRLVRGLGTTGDRPRFVVVSSMDSTEAQATTCRTNVSFFLRGPVGLTRVGRVVQLVTDCALVASGLGHVFRLINDDTPCRLPRSRRQRRISHVGSVLHFLNVATRANYRSVVHVVSLVISRGLNFDSVSFTDILRFSTRAGGVIFREVHQTLGINLGGLTGVFLSCPRGRVLVRCTGGLFNCGGMRGRMLGLGNIRGGNNRVSLRRFFSNLLRRDVVRG